MVNLCMYMDDFEEYNLKIVQIFFARHKSHRNEIVEHCISVSTVPCKKYTSAPATSSTAVRCGLPRCACHPKAAVLATCGCRFASGMHKNPSRVCCPSTPVTRRVQLERLSAFSYKRIGDERMLKNLQITIKCMQLGANTC